MKAEVRFQRVMGSGRGRARSARVRSPDPSLQWWSLAPGGGTSARLRTWLTDRSQGHRDIGLVVLEARCPASGGFASLEVNDESGRTRQIAFRELNAREFEFVMRHWPQRLRSRPRAGLEHRGLLLDQS